MHKIKIFSLLILLFFTLSAKANTLTTKIHKMGCHKQTNACFVYVEEPIKSNCPSNDNSFRWDGTTDPSGKAILSILLTAHSTGKSVTFWESGCFSDFPTFSFATLNKI
ncbi:MAG TPA: hypothetical protein ENH88_17060 [Pseudoalteromonas prydzensis]|uniref:Uncharacterized protein n=1 Tax=Pseudoalteromonas prydzensis TaxID=182141 RepID=A0A7V1D1F9_9GAMM|nr:hypothetical protein [Pseudoalteromonas prydzensis]HEA18115.1 hypothetical protein [Pseudoalteromonas prydzensis]